jgi:DNA polymerase-1
MSKKRLFLLDAYALIFRGYYALIKNPRINSKGEDTSAIMGFMNSLFDVIKREKPDHLAVCFDKGGSKERTELFPEYKANRLETPDAIKLAVPYIQEILKAMHIPVVVLEGLEADDIIGTLAKQAEKEDYQVFMVTPDKDFGQLVSENIFMYRPARMGNGVEIWGIPEIQKRFGVERPEQVIDYLGMMGDASDNIPGLPGVGEKTAKKFLEEFGSMENLLANTDKLKGKMKEKVAENAALGMLSKQLATINIHCDVTFNAAAFELSSPDSEKVQAIFETLEFRRLTEQFLKIFFSPIKVEGQTFTTTQAGEALKNRTPIEMPSAGSGQFGLFDLDASGAEGGTIFTSRKDISSLSHHYQLVMPGLGMKLFLDKLSKQTQVCFDTETTSLNPLEAQLVGIAFSWEAHKGFYISIPENRTEALGILKELKPFFESETIEKIGQNLKYDIKVLHQYQMAVKGSCFDTMLAHYLINPDMRHNMEVLSETYLNYTPIPIEQLIGKKGKNQISMRAVSLEQQTQYAAEDADITFQLAQLFRPELEAAGNESLFQDIEVPLLKVLASMELQGIRLDVPFLKSLSKDLDSDILVLEKSIYEAAGETFNIASPKQLGDVLFEKLKLIEKPKKTKTGQFSTAEEVLSYLAKDHPIIKDVLEYRGLAKLKSTYVDALPLQVSEVTGRVHTDYMQTVAATGRLSSNNPNLQNIPIRTERGRQIRKAFIPRDSDHLLLAADYSQIELRIIAALSEEDNMLAAFRQGADIHAATASKVFGVPLDAVTREQRSHAKTVNFGIIYGVSAFGLSNQTDLSRTEAKALIDTYYESYPKLKAYMNHQVSFARENGYVETVMGRRRYLKDINANNAIVRGAAERNAVNAPIQGSAADIIKLAMIDIQKRLETQGFQTKMLLQVHDELVFDVYKPELEQIRELVTTAMESAYSLSVPLSVEIGTGENWLQAH